MTDSIDDIVAYKCAACGKIELGALLGRIDEGLHKGAACCPNCDAGCTDLLRVRYEIVEQTR